MSKDLHLLLHDLGWTSECESCRENISKLCWMFAWNHGEYWTKNIYQQMGTIGS